MSKVSDVTVGIQGSNFGVTAHDQNNDLCDSTLRHRQPRFDFGISTE